MATNRNLALVCNGAVCLANVIDNVQLFARGVVLKLPAEQLFTYIYRPFG